MQVPGREGWGGCRRRGGRETWERARLRGRTVNNVRPCPGRLPKDAAVVGGDGDPDLGVTNYGGQVRGVL